ncbi:HAD family hydrolase [Herbaspirillum sp. ST 5-3]|uniref:HAD family hydrolase n=1 Tax=Oxalobacteraceae TaxID=75682 RepID=UPI0010A3D64E|nr:HAD family hydrolase [Herbaspirillum sp. ST 5-3]
MIDIDIPGYRHLSLSHLVVDFNGTLAYDGTLCEGVKPQLTELATLLTVHVVTGNTYGTADDELRGSPCQIVLLPPEGQAQAKRDIVQRLGADVTVAIGNGRNDTQMMQLAMVAIAVIGAEGAAFQTLAAADVVTNNIHAALGMLQHHQRLIATLRS